MKNLRQLAVLTWPAILVVAGLGFHLYHVPILGRVAPEASPELVRRLAAIFSYFALAWLAGRVWGLALDWRGSRRRKPPRLLKELISLALFVVALIAATATLFGGAAGGALAGSGLVIAIIGFAIRNVLADILSGVALGVEAPFRIGDWIDIDGTVRGRVVEIGWRSTRLQTRDDTYMILPNAQIARQRMTNYSAPRKHYRAQVEIFLSHEFPIATAKDLLTEALADCESILPTPKPDVRAVSHHWQGVRLVIRYWVPSFADDIDCRDAVLSVADKVLREHSAAPKWAYGIPIASDQAANLDISSVTGSGAASGMLGVNHGGRRAA